MCMFSQWSSVADMMALPDVGGFKEGCDPRS